MSKPDKNHPPKALVWLESSVTTMHLKHMAMLTRAMEAKGFEVHVLTSEDTLKQFEKAGGKLTKAGYCAADSEVDFGKHTHFLPAMPSQITYNNGTVVQIVDYTLTPFEFIGSHTISHKRYEDIKEAVDKVKPDALVTSLWPGGYGPFTGEIDVMIKESKKHNRDCKVYSLANDIPYIDNWHNHPGDKAQDFDKVDRTFVRGNGTVRLSEYLPLSRKAEKAISYVGDFVEPLPPRTPMPEKDRKVLVTYGTRESGWKGDNYKRYFGNIIKAAPFTNVKNNPWELVVSKHCPDQEYKEIEQAAKQVSEDYRMKISVRRGEPDKAFRQEVADAALRIAQYDIQVIDDVHTGVPAVITLGNMDRFTCGSMEGEDRLNVLAHSGAHVEGLRQFSLKYVDETAEAINYVNLQARSRPFTMPLDAPEKAASIMASDFKHHAQGASGQPDPEMKPKAKPQQQTDPDKKRSDGKGA